MPITTYDPDDQYTAGNTTINIMPAVAAAALDKATIAEWDAGTTIQEATEEFSIGTDASTISRKKIGDTVSTQKPGARTYNISDTVLVASSPQAANTLIEGLTIDAIKYIGVRPGLSDTTALCTRCVPNQVISQANCLLLRHKIIKFSHVSSPHQQKQCSRSPACPHPTTDKPPMAQTSRLRNQALPSSGSAHQAYPSASSDQQR